MGLPSFHSGYPAFLQKKWRLEFLSSPAILKRFLNLKTQNFAVKSNSENRFTFSQKNSDCPEWNKSNKIFLLLLVLYFIRLFSDKLPCMYKRKYRK